MSQGARFMTVFLMQGLITLVIIWAALANNSQVLDMAAGAAVMLFVLMLIIWLFTNVAKNIQ